MRSAKTARNALASVGQNYALMLMSFITRTVFIYTLGEVYLGVNGLFTNIFNMLSLMELGVGSAITFFMYKPLAEDDTAKLSGLMMLYAKMYRIIGLLVAAVGVACIPFLKYIVNTQVYLPDLNIYYLILLSNAVFTYFFSYRRSLLEADQKAYINSLNNMTFKLLANVLQIIILLLYKNFILYLAIQTFCTMLANISISMRVKRMYPKVKGNKAYELSKDEKKHIFSRMFAVFFHKLGTVVLQDTDNILISIYISTEMVGFYSNYTLITAAITSSLNQVFAGMIASVGNLQITESKERVQYIYEKTNFLAFWLYGFCSICLLVLLNPFILIWTGQQQYVLSFNTVILIVVAFYLSGMRMVPSNFNYASGLFWNTRYKPLAEATINLAVSLLLAPRYGVEGVLTGTVVSYLCTSVWVDAYVLYKNLFHVSAWRYFKKYFFYLAITAATAVLFTFITSLVPETGVSALIIKLLICGFGINGLYLLLFFKTDDFKYLFETLNRLLMLLKKKLSKTHNADAS